MSRLRQRSVSFLDLRKLVARDRQQVFFSIWEWGKTYHTKFKGPSSHKLGLYFFINPMNINIH
jgi:hypothetical protein